MPNSWVIDKAYKDTDFLLDIYLDELNELIFTWRLIFMEYCTPFSYYKYPTGVMVMLSNSWVIDTAYTDMISYCVYLSRRIKWTNIYMASHFIEYWTPFCLLQNCTAKLMVVRCTVSGHDCSSAPIFPYEFHIKPFFFSNKYVHIQ